jgi:hypothetical protein
MKKIIFLLLTSLTINSIFAQTKKINEVNTFTIKNSGAILNKEKDVDGYYFFYEIDKLKKGDREFAIQILDNNLVEVAKKTYVNNKNTFLMKSSFNNQAMMFAMANYKEKKINLLTYDKQANEKSSIDIPLETKEIRWIEYMKQTGEFNILFPVQNKGFLYNKVTDNKKIGYSLKYYPTDGGIAWEYNSAENSNEILVINPIEVNENIIVALEFSRPGILSRKVSIKTLVIDINTGKLLFDREYSKNKNPRMISNAFLNSNNSVVFLGEYFKGGDNIFDAKSEGIFAEEISLSGNTTSESLVSWKNDVSKYLKSTGDEKDLGYIYFHDIVKTGTGDFYAIGEKYKKTASAGGIAMAIVSRGQTPITQLTITDAVIFKFDSSFKLKDIKTFEKGKSRVPSLTDFGSPQLNAHALKNYGAFDYEFTQIDKKNDRFYSCFIDYERLKGEKNKNAFKTIIYDDGQLTQDKIYLSTEDRDFKVLPAKVGYVTLIEYIKKDKEINVHLEKLNIN